MRLPALLLVAFAACLLCVNSTRLSSFAAPASFLHVSDIHIDPTFDVTVPSYPDHCRLVTSDPKPVPMPSNCSKKYEYGCFGKYRCDPPLSLLTSAISSMKQTNPRPSFIILTGDLSAHLLPTATLTLEAISEAVQSFRRAYPTTPIIFSLGNNDFFPKYSVGVPIKQWLKQLLPVLGPLMLDNEARKTFLQWGYYCHCLNNNLSIISLNSILFSTSYDSYPPKDSTPQNDQFDWLQSQLIASSAAGRKVYIIGHIPPANNMFQTQMLWYENYTMRFLQIVAPYEDTVVKGMFFAHTHRDDFRVFDVPSASNGGVSLLIAPSISPVTLTNPSYRAVLFEAETFTPVDYVQYYTELYKLQQGQLDWNIEYDFGQEYNVTDLSTNSLYAFFQELKTHNALWWKWYEHYSVLYSADKFVFFCAMNYPERKTFLDCAADANKAIPYHEAD